MPSLGTKSRRLSASSMYTADCGIIPPVGLCCTAMLGRSPARSSLATVVVVLVATFVSLADAIAFDRTNLPLKNWGGFSEYRDATYDDLERLVPPCSPFETDQLLAWLGEVLGD